LVLRERVSAVNGDEQEWYAGQLEGLWNNAIIMRTGVQSWIRILPSADLTTDSLPHTCQRRLRFCLCVPSQLSNAQVPANWAFLQILAQSPGNLPTHRPAIRFQEMTVQAPDEDHSWRQQPMAPAIGHAVQIRPCGKRRSRSGRMVGHSYKARSPHLWRAAPARAATARAPGRRDAGAGGAGHEQRRRRPRARESGGHREPAGPLARGAPTACSARSRAAGTPNGEKTARHSAGSDWA
jgi:hypothetical protein